MAINLLALILYLKDLYKGDRAQILKAFKKVTDGVYKGV